jgi:hypothetical protein
MKIDELKSHKIKIENELGTLEREYKNCETQHYVHAILSVFTGGFWLIVWLITNSKNNSRRKEIESLIGEGKLALLEINEKLIPEKQNEELKECFWCAEKIKKNAKLCRYCGKEV